MKKFQNSTIAFLISFLASCIGIFAFFTDINSIFDFFTPNEAARAIYPTATLPPTQPVGSWNNALSARKPTLNEIRADNPPSIWITNGVEVRDMTAPGTDQYAGSVNASQEYLFPVYWCASSADLLQQNMDNINTTFTVNDETVPEKYIFSYNYDTNNGWKCSYHAVVFSDWDVAKQYTLQVHRMLLAELSDGQSNYPAGEYIFSLTLTVK
ncbi:MAG: hypothetical protein U0V18_07525 [Anaerolineales bacterium]